MIFSIFLYAAAILGCILTLFIISGKINTRKKQTGYLVITLIPFFVIMFPLLFVKSFIGEYSNYFIFIPVGFIGIEIFILLSFFVIKLNLVPKLFINSDYTGNEKVKSAQLLLHYSLFAALLYLIPILGLIYVSFSIAVCAVGVILVPFLFLFMLSLPLSIASVIVFSGVVILSGIVVVFSINSAIRISYVSREARKHIVRHIAFMFFPVFNIITLINLCLIAKREIGNN